MKSLSGILLLCLMATISYGQLFINEVDYDQPSSDTGEFIELAALAGTYAAVTVELINGNNDTEYTTVDVGTITISDESSGYGFYTIGSTGMGTDIELSPGSDGWLQNGGPDGIVLKVDGTIIAAVSYEGDMTYEGFVMENIGEDLYVADQAFSISRMGGAESPWEHVLSTPGAINTNQTFDPNANFSPTAIAGADQAVEQGENVTLDGSSSVDSDGTIVSYLWEQVSGPTVTLSNAATAVASFVVPSVSESTDWVFSLTVTDDEGAVGTDEITISTLVTGTVANLAGFRAGTEGEPYTITGEVVLTWTQTFRGQKYIQDASAAILIDDYLGIIETAYVIGDGITGMTGTLSSYGGMLQFIPLVDPGAPSSTGNTVVPTSVTLADLSGNFEDYEAQLVLVEGVTFTGGDGTAVFANGMAYPVTDATGSFQFRTTFYDADFIGTIIPETPFNVIGIANSRDDGNYFSARDLADFDDGTISPTFENESHSPTFVTSANQIEVSIDIVPGDESQTIASATIFYGTNGTLLNESSMWLDNGNTWMGDIPAQDPNTFLEYEFIATDNLGAEFDSYTYELAIASAELTTIASIHADPVVGQVVTVEGIVTIGSGLLQTGLTKAYLQDESGRGINLFQYDELPLNRGDLVKVVGVVDVYQTTVEIKDFSYQLISSDNLTPSPIVLTPGEANRAEYEGTMIGVAGIVTDFWEAGGGYNILVGDETDTSVVRIWNTTGVDVTYLELGWDGLFIGVGSQYNGTFQLLLAYDEDIIHTEGIDRLDNQPSAFALSPAYPNPFNPSTTLSWTIMEASELSLRVFDVRGREVAKLAQGYSSPGLYSMTWDASALSSGVYFVQLITPTESAIQKVMLVK